MSAQVIELNPEEKREVNRNLETIEVTLDTQRLRDLYCRGILSKMAFIYFMLEFRYQGIQQPYNVDYGEFADAISFEDDYGKLKQFTPEDVALEVAKLQKKEAVTIKTTAVQLSLF